MARFSPAEARQFAEALIWKADEAEDSQSGFLFPDTQYTLGIGTMTEEGNISFVETSFTTAVK
jgi:hypothetical protein